MNYINLFRKLAYKDKDIDYFRGLPGEEGKLFREMYSWLNIYLDYAGEEKRDRIKCIFNRIRANYLGIVFQDKYEGDAATLYEIDEFEEDILTAVYFQAVKDPTQYEEFDDVMVLIYNKYRIYDFPKRLLSILEEGVEEESRFESSFTPEIDNWYWKEGIRNFPPGRWFYWRNGNYAYIFDKTKLFLHKDFEEIEFIVSLFSTKGWKLAACNALEEAIKEGYKEWNK